MMTNCNSLVFCLTAFLFASCSDTASDIFSTEGTEKVKSLSDLSYLGDAHNDYMEFAYRSFPDERKKTKANATLYTRTAKLSILAKYRSDFAPGLCLFQPECGLTFPDNEGGDAYLNQREKIADYLDRQIILGSTSRADKRIILGLIDGLNNVKSVDQILEVVEQYTQDWEDQRFVANNQGGDLSAATLSIANSSADYWMNNPDAVYKLHGEEPIQKIAWFLVAMVVRNDVIGGMAGILSSQAAEALVTGQWGGNDGMVTGEETAAAFLAGAATGSLGL